MTKRMDILVGHDVQHGDGESLQLTNLLFDGVPLPDEGKKYKSLLLVSVKLESEILTWAYSSSSSLPLKCTVAALTSMCLPAIRMLVQGVDGVYPKFWVLQSSHVPSAIFDLETPPPLFLPFEPPPRGHEASCLLESVIKVKSSELSALSKCKEKTMTACRSIAES